MEVLPALASRVRRSRWAIDQKLESKLKANLEDSRSERIAVHLETPLVPGAQNDWLATFPGAALRRSMD